jgi:heme exporter protein A
VSALLTLQDVTVARGGRVLCAGIDLVLAPGAAAVVRGPNGVGKTSLLRVAAGLLSPAAGTVVRSSRVAWLGEASALDDERPLAAALAFWARLDGSGEVDARVGSALAALDLGGLADVPVRFLSTGQRRRGALARIVASGAPLWLLDEPASGLDTAAQTALAAAIGAHRANGGAVVAATHQPLGLDDAAEVRLG